MPKPIAIIAHDAGGAEILSSYVRRQKADFCYSLAGPALTIFQRKIGSFENLSLEDAITTAESVLCGTSWQSDLEFNALALASAAGKPSASFIDHWVNYPERFCRQTEVRLPDEIWVGDEIAVSLARNHFPQIPIKLVANPYFKDIQQEIASLALDRGVSHAKKGLSVLYVCEPIREHAARAHGDERHWGYVEEDALRYFLSNTHRLGANIERIRIRPHPSEPVDKYSWASNEFPLPILPGGKASLLEEIADSDLLVGCGSMAMVVGLLAGKRVISCIPPGGKTRELPQPEIERLRDVIPVN